MVIYSNLHEILIGYTYLLWKLKIVILSCMHFLQGLVKCLDTLLFTFPWNSWDRREICIIFLKKEMLHYILWAIIESEVDFKRICQKFESIIISFIHKMFHSTTKLLRLTRKVYLPVILNLIQIFTGIRQWRRKTKLKILIIEFLQRQTNL